GDVRTLETVHDGQVARDHVDDGAGNEERRDLAWTALVVGVIGVLDQAEAANAGADRHTDTLGVLFGGNDAGILDRLDTGSQAVLDEGIHTTGVLGRQVLRDVEVLHLACNLRGETAGIELGDSGNAGLAGDEIGPG